MTAAVAGGRVVVAILAALVGLALVPSCFQAPAQEQSSFHQKLDGLQEKIDAWVAAGGDPVTVIPLTRHLDKLLKTGTPEQVEAQVDRIIAVVATTPTSSTRQNRLTGLQERIDDWIAAGGNPAEVLPLGDRMNELLETGTPEEINAHIDRILALISKPLPPKAQVAVDEGPVPVRARSIPADANIAFYSVRSRLGPEVYTMKDDGTDLTQITFINPQPLDQPFEHVAVSPDRKMIASNRYLKGGAGPTGVWMIDVEAGTRRRLVSHFFAAGSGGVDWSPDGFLYFSGRPAVRAKDGIFRIRPDGSKLTQVVALDPADPGVLGDVSVSEDGSMLAYVRGVLAQQGPGPALKTQIWVSRSDGSKQRMVDDGGPEIGSQGGFPVGDFDPELSPDNQYVVFSRTNTQHRNFRESFNTAHDLWVASVDGSSPARRLTRPGPISIVPDWRGGKIVYTEYSEKDGYQGLVLINPDGTGYRRLEPDIQNMQNGGRHGKWIPD